MSDDNMVRKMAELFAIGGLGGKSGNVLEEARVYVVTDLTDSNTLKWLAHYPCFKPNNGLKRYENRITKMDEEAFDALLKRAEKKFNCHQCF
mmetsp:Transcript_16217/g.25208  ORF Transcript_16217/g.25208 Transcript_16217/m.25208 type:complete len:92 (+) Transcript_16217:66-341(+)